MWPKPCLMGQYFNLKQGNSLVYWPTISFICWDFSMFYQIFLSPQVKRWAIITYKRGIFELSHELPNDSPLGGPWCPHKKKKKDLGS